MTHHPPTMRADTPAASRPNRRHASGRGWFGDERLAGSYTILKCPSRGVSQTLLTGYRLMPCPHSKPVANRAVNLRMALCAIGEQRLSQRRGCGDLRVLGTAADQCIHLAPGNVIWWQRVHCSVAPCVE